MTIEIIDLAGDPSVRGFAFGRARRSEIQAYLHDWLASLEDVGIADPQTYIACLLRDSDFLTAIQAHTPDLLEEVRNIAAGAEQPIALLLASQLMDEEWAYRPDFLKRAEALQKCSSIAIRLNAGVTWIGQNMDLGVYTAGHQVLLRLVGDTTVTDALVFTVGGMIGLLGVNARGIGVCVNSLPQLPANREGLPVAFVIRRLLQMRTLEEAVHAVCTLPHATGQHYLIADSTQIRSFEASPAGVFEYHSVNEQRVFHTNHPLADKTRNTKGGENEANTIARLKFLTDCLSLHDVDLEAIKSALSSTDTDYPICRLGKSVSNSLNATTAFTTGSMISALRSDSEEIESWVSAGPPCLAGYLRIPLPRS